MENKHWTCLGEIFKGQQLLNNLIQMSYVNGINYNVSEYNCRCPVCDKQSKNNKSLIDHIFHRNLKNDEQHVKFAKFLRDMYDHEFLQKAKKKCPVCNKLFSRNLGGHFARVHKDFYNNQKKLVVKFFLGHKSTYEIANMQEIYLDKRTIYRHSVKSLGHEKFLAISRAIFSKKRKAYWITLSEDERKKKMALVRNAEWGNLTPEQRKKHPWVIAGRKASLESSIRGSRNQKYAFELLRGKLPNYNWIYNYVLNENWQIDIASPEQKIFIEWDGRHHRIPIHGEGYLNNRKNRDHIKNKIVTEQLKGTMIRVNDSGRFNKKFVEEKIGKIVEMLSKKVEKEIVIL